MVDKPTDAFWRGNFGDEYHRRNVGRVDCNEQFFANVAARGHYEVNTVLEPGAGMGENLIALRSILPGAELTAIEINAAACAHMRKCGYGIKVIEESFLNLAETPRYDLVITKGFLIHINPDDLHVAMHMLHQAVGKYLLIAEYFSVAHEEIIYRGETGRLWRGPFAYDMLYKYADLKLVDCGFASSRAEFPQDDLTFFMLQKTR